MGPVTVRAKLDCYDPDLETSQWRTTFVISGFDTTPLDAGIQMPEVDHLHRDAGIPGESKPDMIMSPAYWSIVLRDPEAQRCAVQRRTADGLCAAIYDNIEKTLTVVSAGTVFRSGRSAVRVTTDNIWSVDVSDLS